MKIAVAYGVWPFWGWKIINHGGWFTQIKGRSWQKKRSSLYRSCRHERVILPDYRITSKVHQNYITFTSDRGCTTELHQKYIKITSLLRHFYIIFTSDLTSELFVHPPLFLGLLHVLKMVFPAVPATPHGHAINCASVHRYRGGSWWLSGRSSDFSR